MRGSPRFGLWLPRLVGCDPRVESTSCKWVLDAIHTSAPLQLVLSDVWGPAINYFGHKQYYVSFIGDYSTFTWIYLLHNKFEVSKYFLEFQKIVECMLDRKIIMVQSNWGGEYEKLNSFFWSNGIAHIVSCPHTHQ
jgi:hypothetical protein